MSKKNKPRKTARKTSGKTKTSPTEQTVDESRRSLLRKVRNGVIGLAVVGGAGYLLTDHVLATIAEHDLSRVGNGRPTVVQIHDPQCPSCLALQRETRQALKNFDDEELDYVVANIKSPEGSSFASRYGVQHVTLLLFDNEGELKQILRGQRNRETLRSAFQRLL
ncbi:MAG: thioredoxin family protein [Stappiaceae bacterium]